MTTTIMTTTIHTMQLTKKSLKSGAHESGDCIEGKEIEKIFWSFDMPKATRPDTCLYILSHLELYQILDTASNELCDVMSK